MPLGGFQPNRSNRASARLVPTPTEKGRNRMSGNLLAAAANESTPAIMEEAEEEAVVVVPDFREEAHDELDAMMNDLDSDDDE